MLLSSAAAAFVAQDSEDEDELEGRGGGVVGGERGGDANKKVPHKSSGQEANVTRVDIGYTPHLRGPTFVSVAQHRNFGVLAGRSDTK